MAGMGLPPAHALAEARATVTSGSQACAWAWPHTCRLAQLRRGSRKEARVVKGEGSNPGGAIPRARERDVGHAWLRNTNDELNVGCRGSGCGRRVLLHAAQPRRQPGTRRGQRRDGRTQGGVRRAERRGHVERENAERSHGEHLATECANGQSPRRSRFHRLQGVERFQSKRSGQHLLLASACAVRGVGVGLQEKARPRRIAKPDS